MFDVRDGYYYTEEHEWISVSGDNAKFGMSDYAQHELGELVYVDLPKAGTHISFGEEIGAMESVKSVEPIYAPISGTIVELNPALEDEPTKVNSSPYDEGWMAVIKMDDPAEVSKLTDSSKYKTKLNE